MAIPIYETIRLGLGDRIGFPLLEQFVNLPTPAFGDRNGAAARRN